MSLPLALTSYVLVLTVRADAGRGGGPEQKLQELHNILLK